MTGNAQSNGSSNLEIAQSNQDLIMNKGKRKKRNWIIIGVVSAIVIALVITAIVLLTTREDKKTEDQQDPDDTPDRPTLSLEDLLQGKVNPASFNATWASDNELLYIDYNGSLVLHSLEKRNSPTVLLPSTDPVLEGASSFEISADKKYLKIGRGYQKIYRHSYKAKYTIIDLANTSNQRIELGENVDDDGLLLLAEWAPVGNALAFVSKNNVYYKENPLADTIQITHDSGFVNNGIPDWVYEEEVFSSNKALWFSPDGTKLTFGRFDDTEVPLMVLPIYGEPGNNIFQYPRAQIIKYPKVGTQNPLVTLHCVSLNDLSDSNTPTLINLDAPSDLNQTQRPILSAVSWITSDEVVAIWMNRVQNSAAVVVYNIVSGSSTRQIILNLNEQSGWLELFTPPLFSKDGSELVMILSVDQGNDKGAYRHVVKVPKQTNAVQEPLTTGSFVVTELLGWHHDTNEIFYLANSESDPSLQHLYSVSATTRTTKCISCEIKSKNTNTNCLYNTAEFSKDSSHYVLTCAGPDVPDIALYSLEGKIIDWDDNKELQELTKGKLLPKTIKLTFEIDGGYKAQVSLKLPPNFDDSGKTKYPMLVNVYAGPDSFQVIEKFNLDWGSYLAANKSIIYATIDGRGSGLKGDKILFESYRRLGTVEIADQINVTKQIQEQLSYIDNSRTAVWGWSYGGYASGMILATDTEGIFKCGISVAPVTDWTLYDSIYTERFMGLPNENEQGYNNSNLLLKYEGLRDKQYFLIHGTYDDNVHYQQSMLWARVLEQRDILFRQLSYPDEDHGLGSVRPHLYHSLENFLDECFIQG